ncbi:hypothetical protein CLV36_101484 [Laceyella sediminis]|uniref:Uncharacterized protein n=1 Tax=Laceyella sediminis TaxID=573074 RepID=A0ABX5ETT3_9BACL|nr:hypothetical protein CLV36_101484 [Laceyella sediminis]
MGLWGESASQKRLLPAACVRRRSHFPSEQLETRTQKSALGHFVNRLYEIKDLSPTCLYKFVIC